MVQSFGRHCVFTVYRLYYLYLAHFRRAALSYFRRLYSVLSYEPDGSPKQWSQTLKKKPADGPLGQLDALIKRAGLRLAESTPGEATLAISTEPELAPSDTDDEAFARAMGGVTRISWSHYPISSEAPRSPSLGDPGDEERRLMEAAVAGEPALTVLDHPEYIEGWVGVAGRRFLPSLRNGSYSIQGQIDLHGFSRDEARQAVEEFIGSMSRFRACCVKIVHGRGINSPNDRAILKESLQQWLSTRRLSRNVVAYASAPMSDGGVGAIYVLLRKRS